MERNGIHLCALVRIMHRIAGILRSAAFGGKTNRKETPIMEKANRSIHCTVTSCKNHCSCEDYCSLDSIKVGTHECNPSMDQCTDCMSFQKK